MKVIGIIGPKAAGKETVAAHIKSKVGGNIHSHSEILEEILGILQLPYTRDNAIKLVALRETFGENVLVNALKRRIASETAEVEIITGIRFQNELDHIRSYPDNAVIYIVAPEEFRYQWQKKRMQKSDDHFDQEYFRELESRATEVHITELGVQADYIIENNGSEKELFAKTDQVLNKIFGN